ncbi:hypothetical protein MQX06_001031 [Campylobacter jejuni]|nr:hypothetical protein [Campylobacter jejuni]
MSDLNKIPKETKARQTGRKGERIFSYSIPLDWIESKISGENDYGLDYLIQYEKDGKLTYPFFVQLKSKEKYRIKFLLRLKLKL